MQRYFGEVMEGRAILSEDDVFHLCRVMRGKIDTELEVVSNGRTYLARIEKLKPLLIKIQKEVKEDNELKSAIILLFAPLKGDRTELVLQKATEIGVAEIVLLNTSRTIVRIRKDDITDKLSRYQKILKEAAEQSRRSHIPLISYIDGLSKVASIKAHHKLIAYEQLSGPTTALIKAVKQIKQGERVALIIGPEGGFSNEEIEEAKDNGFTPVSLGSRILRAETASIYALSVLASIMES